MDWFYYWAVGACATGALAAYAEPDADGTALACTTVLWPVLWAILLVAGVVAVVRCFGKGRGK
jgi:hypothetical protein|tara:strand:- start:7932 stop:8120 length:189 start_codon:yes stop_codon:yes gene_type:complete